MAGSSDLQLPESIRTQVYGHMADLKANYEQRGWGGAVGMGERPAVIVIDLAEKWVNPSYTIGSDLEGVVEHTRTVLDAARAADIPIFFTTMAFGEDDPPWPASSKGAGKPEESALGSAGVQLDPRLGRLPHEKFIVKKWASCFKGTDLQEMLNALQVDTLIVTGCSTSHCVYATCRDACSGFRVIVPEEAVGDRCEIFHLVNLLDIQISIGDVMPVASVVEALAKIEKSKAA